MKNLYSKMMRLQSDLKCNKGQYNSFGNYKYRSCEDILEAVKPILKELSLFLTINDEIVNLGDRFYIKATATVYDVESDDKLSSSAFARECLNKKGMDDSQITGACSSYARKYALNGLLCIDDTKDADTESYTKKANNKSISNIIDNDIEKPSELECEECGYIIKSQKSIDYYTKNKNARVLCFDCSQKNK